MNKNITFIGPGEMAEAMISGLLRNDLAEANHIVASGPNVPRGHHLAEEYSINTMTDNQASVKDADVVVLSIKPQHMKKVLNELKGKIRKEAVVLSIVAGATIEKMSDGLNHELIVRSMPNTPAKIGEGITVWTASKEVSDEQKEIAQKILSALGHEVYMKDENYLDMATALSGTGPAYVFLFMEALVDAGVHLGFPRRIAEQLVKETVRGSVDYFDSSDEEIHLASYRDQVTSPGGTTAEALYYLEKMGFRTALSRAVWAAYNRSIELGKQNNK